MQGLELITSKTNNRLKHFRRVRDGKETGQIFVEGVRLAEEALRSGVTIVDCLVSAEARREERISSVLELLRVRGVRGSETPAKILSGVADTANSQGIILLAERPASGRERIAEARATGGSLFVYLHRISDPANLGAVFRSAEAAGAAGVILSPGSSDPFSPKALRTGMGANLRMPVWDRVSEDEFFPWAADNKLATVASDIKGKRSYSDLDWRTPAVLILGSEAHGIEAETLQRVDEIVQIPMQNGVESLNVAVAAGIILFEAARQRSDAS